jgi:hypothetical protein
LIRTTVGEFWLPYNKSIKIKQPKKNLPSQITNSRKNKKVVQERNISLQHGSAVYNIYIVTEMSILNINQNYNITTMKMENLEDGVMVVMGDEVKGKRKNFCLNK